jgi:hypothetical protein
MTKQNGDDSVSNTLTELNASESSAGASLSTAVAGAVAFNEAANRIEAAVKDIEVRKNDALAALERRKDTLLIVLKAASTTNPTSPPLEPNRDEKGLMTGPF